jgi:predicted RNase H-like HicB family nuclease
MPEFSSFFPVGAQEVFIETDSTGSQRFEYILNGEVVELPGCYTQAPDLPALEANMREAISVYRSTAQEDLHGPEFVGTWRVEVPA